MARNVGIATIIRLKARLENVRGPCIIIPTMLSPTKAMLRNAMKYPKNRTTPLMFDLLISGLPQPKSRTRTDNYTLGWQIKQAPTWGRGSGLEVIV